MEWSTFHSLQDLHQAHLKEVGLTQNLKTMTSDLSQNLTTLDLL